MNERIKELMFESGLGYMSSAHPILVEKFAQLIVKECADICYNRDYACGSAYGEQIEKHFGVEE
jgi:hypothetical protein